ncbi:MAG: hypothetical protein ACI9F2_000387 [Lysobacterales bacterium]|jgi:hypothetical protein
MGKGQKKLIILLSFFFVTVFLTVHVTNIINKEIEEYVTPSAIQAKDKHDTTKIHTLKNKDLKPITIDFKNDPLAPAVKKPKKENLTKEKKGKVEPVYEFSYDDTILVQ